MKTLVDVGNCSADHSAIRMLAEREFGAKVVRVHGLSDCLTALGSGAVALVTVNRKLDRDHSEGLEIIKHLQADDSLRSIPVMLITNFPEYQQAAVAEGAVQGFGKSDLLSPKTRDTLGAFLSEG